MQPASRPRRRRRSADEAEREIVEAAEAFLRERPFRELTVDEVMRRTELSRPSFYIHFRDRHQLVLRVVACLRAELSEMSDRWYKGQGDGATLVREALEGVVGVYERNGPVVRALADAATDDPDIERVYSGLVEAFIDTTADHIEAEIRAGHIEGLDPRPTATALIHLTERYLGETFGRGPQAPPQIAWQTLAEIWTRTLYPR
jgi:AcrR family transcriptional regulator